MLLSIALLLVGDNFTAHYSGVFSVVTMGHSEAAVTLRASLTPSRDRVRLQHGTARLSRCRVFFTMYLFCVHQSQALALRVEHLVWDVEAMSAGLSMGQLDTLKAVLLDQVARVDEAKVSRPTRSGSRWRPQKHKAARNVFRSHGRNHADVSLSAGHSARDAARSADVDHRAILFCLCVCTSWCVAACDR